MDMVNTELNKMLRKRYNIIHNEPYYFFLPLSCGNNNTEIYILYSETSF